MKNIKQKINFFSITKIKVQKFSIIYKYTDIFFSETNTNNKQITYYQYYQMMETTKRRLFDNGFYKI